MSFSRNRRGSRIGPTIHDDAGCCQDFSLPSIDSFRGISDQLSFHCDFASVVQRAIQDGVRDSGFAEGHALFSIGVS
jgi:hypothetical protein